MASGGVAISPIRNADALPPGYTHDQPGYMHEQLLDESILIYVAVSGSMIPMRVLESDSIESVKLRIQTYKGFVVKNQKLVCGGRELARSNSLVREYGVADGNVLHLVLRLSDLQVINVKTSCGKEFTFHVERSRDVGYVKRQIARKKRGLVDVDDQEVICNGECVGDQRLINDICKDNNDAVIHLFVRKSAKIRAKPVERNFELSIVAPQLNDRREGKVDGESGSGSDTENNLVAPRKPPDRDLWLEHLVVNRNIEIPLVLENLLNSTFDGLDRGNYPIRSSEGTGGAYFMLDALGKKYISVFKPVDEEPMAVYNPRGLPISVDGEGLKKGTRVGEGALREVAAYILDHPKNGRRFICGEDKGFAGVPPTMMVKCLHNGFNHPDGLTVKIGSLQMFMENHGSCEDMGPSAFPVEEVHKICVLDIRMANADRHAGNILMSKGEDGRTVLIPIDHGYCLPESFEDCTFDWLYWPQARKPYNADTIEYIKSLDAEEDIALLNLYGWKNKIRYVSQAMKIGALGVPSYRTFSLEELEAATDNFDTSTFLAEGSHGQMYRGQLKDGSVVAIRCLKMKRSHSTQLYASHRVYLKTHRHLVSALGHCFECNLDDSSVIRLFLIFEYVPNGTLRSWISERRARRTLSWTQRIAAAIGVAKGIEFLHTGIVPGAFSNSLKITDVLLDQNLVAKISSYNLPLLSETMEKVGTQNSSGRSKELNNARRTWEYMMFS